MGGVLSKKTIIADFLLFTKLVGFLENFPMEREGGAFSSQNFSLHIKADLELLQNSIQFGDLVWIDCHSINLFDFAYLGFFFLRAVVCNIFVVNLHGL